MKNTALVVIDMVYDFTNENGKLFYPQNREILPRIRKLVDYFHDRSMMVVYFRHSYRKGKFDKNTQSMRVGCIEGTGGDEIDEMLPVHEEDYVIKKRRYSGFFGTDFDLVLRENNISNVVLVGTKTNNCIRATATDAHYLNYNAIVVSDCVGTNSEVANEVHLYEIDRYLGQVMDSQTLISKIEENTL